jgi:histidinol-phosphate aminotransferase
VLRVWPSEGNFLLARFANAERAHAACEQAGVLVRDFSRAAAAWQGCLRITVGTAAENKRLLAALRKCGAGARERRHG